jgi:AbrB family looped-hinge helix DNA binding protein
MSEETFLAKVQKLHRISIDNEVRRKLDIKEGDMVRVTIRKESVGEVRKK